eukprot:TRINITY_DN796_c0_g1_i1.p1 TRINITY_DN796_c0_g1~~TRINITY_DN796_c0_g1_i1.p1  ORF type:complete len:457 (+),score=153.80 TRINITY_DN796_c0_g1_i1:216-1586(+)
MEDEGKVVNRVPVKKSVPPKEVNPEEEEKKRLRKEAEEKRREEMRALMKKKAVKEDGSVNEERSIKPAASIEEFPDPAVEELTIVKPVAKKSVPPKEVDLEEEEKKRVRKEAEEKRREEMRALMQRSRAKTSDEISLDPEIPMKTSGESRSKLSVEIPGMHRTLSTDALGITGTSLTSPISPKFTSLPSSPKAALMSPNTVPSSPMTFTKSASVKSTPNSSRAASPVAVPFSPVKLNLKLNIEDFMMEPDTSNRSLSDIPKYTRKDMLKVRSLVLNQVKEETSSLLVKLNEIKAKMDQEVRQREMLTAAIVKQEENLKTLPNTVDKLKKIRHEHIGTQQALQELQQIHDLSKDQHENYQRTEQDLKERLLKVQKDLQTSQARFTALKGHAEKKLSLGSDHCNRLVQIHDKEMLLLKAKIQMEEAKEKSLEIRVAAVQRENDEILRVCDAMFQVLEQ